MLKKVIPFSLAILIFVSLNVTADNNQLTNNKKNTQKNKKITPEEVWEQELNDPLLEKAKQEKLKYESKENAPPEEKSLWHIMLMYIPNRLIDLTDIFTMDLGFGPEASIILTMTKWAEFGGSYGDRYFIGKQFNRQYGGGYSGGYLGSALCYNKEEAFTDYTFGTVRPYAFLKKDFSIAKPNEEVYRDSFQDFWKIGIHAGWLVDVSVAIHPVAIANFFTGFLFIRLTDTEDI